MKTKSQSQVAEPGSPMPARLFQAFRQLVYEHGGISLHEGKEALVQTRIQKRMRALGIVGAEDYLRRLHGPGAEEEIVHLIDAISTNVTSFYREPEHFQIMQDWLRKARQSGQQRFRIWSAACSTGEEPYTIAMAAHEAVEPSRLDFKILATDISTRVLAAANAGVFRADKLGPVSSQQRSRFFVNHPEGLQAGPELKNLIACRWLNLSRPPFPMQGPMDIVFCRNVMIYFDDTVRRGLLAEIERLLRPGGLLFVGHAESLTSMISTLRCVKPSVYVKR